ncbi:MAG: hypothetical protein ACTHJT_11960 [Cytophaga sp.]|uniref:hypothetical protein n=1 Tax=Cytophaga sp. TaxID=29535 RepID=UPI003F7FBEC8
MIKSFFILFLSLSGCLIFSSSVSVAPPDPDDFLKFFLETIKKNDVELYVKTFEVSDADLEWMTQTCLASSYITENQKASTQYELSQKSGIKDKLTTQLRENFSYIQEWIKRDSINVNNLKLVNFFYKLELEKRYPFYTIDRSSMYLKHGTRFYKININKIVFLNGHWKYGEIHGSSIEEVDKDLNSIYNAMDDDYTAEPDNAAVDTVVYDTTITVDPAYDHNAGFALTDKQAKKAAKIQKKIDALYEQRDKIIYKQQ